MSLQEWGAGLLCDGPTQNKQNNKSGETPMPLLYRMMALVFLLAPMFAAPAGAQTPERRFALVIGNSEYKAGRHPTAANDAGLVAEKLRDAGFGGAGGRALAR